MLNHSRRHDQTLPVKIQTMSLEEIKQKGQRLKIDYGFHMTVFGECFIAMMSQGVCNLFFINSKSCKNTLEEFYRQWEGAQVHHNQEATGEIVGNIFNPFSKKYLHLFCRGTNFQIKVWKALLLIPPGQVVTYKMIAERIGHPRAVRAVGNAIGKNPIAYLIPCHRVIRESGQLGGYRWGIGLKRRILESEGMLL